MPRHPDLLIERLSPPATGYPLSDVATAFDALARREAIRPILTL
jgi:hypothetical protein